MIFDKQIEIIKRLAKNRFVSCHFTVIFFNVTRSLFCHV